MTKARDIASAIPAPSTVDATELGFLDGVTSAIQTQVDAKTAKSTLTTTGDIYYASAANTPARLAIGSTSNVLTVAGGIPSWAAPSAGALVLVKAPTTFTNVAGTGTTFDDVFTSTYKTYVIVIESIFAATAANDLLFNLRYAGPNTQTVFYGSALRNSYDSSTYSATVSNATDLLLHPVTGQSGFGTVSVLTIQGAGQTAYPIIFGSSGAQDESTLYLNNGIAGNSRLYTGFLLKSSSSNVTGTVAVYAYARS